MISQGSRTHLEQQRCGLFIRAPEIAAVKKHWGGHRGAQRQQGHSCRWAARGHQRGPSPGDGLGRCSPPMRNSSQSGNGGEGKDREESANASRQTTWHRNGDSQLWFRRRCDVSDGSSGGSPAESGRVAATRLASDVSGADARTPWCMPGGGACQILARCAEE